MVQYVNNNLVLAETRDDVIQEYILIVADEVIQNIITRVEIMEQYGNGWSPVLTVESNETKPALKL